MEVRHLQYFLAVANASNFTRAAEQLNVAQPSLSKQIADLEVEIGAKLFVRTARGVSLTAAGQSLVLDANRWVQTLESIKENTRRAARGQTGKLSVGFFAAPTVRYLPKLICTYRSRYPDVAIELHEMNPVAQKEAFENGSIDVAFNRPLAPADLERFERVELFREHLQLAFQSDHNSWAPNKTIHIKELANENVVMVERDQAPGLYDLTVGFCTRNGFSPKIVATPSMMSTVLTFVASGVGVSIVPESVKNLNYTGGVSFIDVIPKSPQVPLELQWLKTNSSPTVKAFAALVSELKGTISQSFV